MRLKVVTRKGIRLEKEVFNVVLPAEFGKMEVLPSHAGTVVLMPGGKLFYDESFIVVEKSIARILKDEILVLTEGVMRRVFD